MSRGIVKWVTTTFRQLQQQIQPSRIMAEASNVGASPAPPVKLTGRAFYESIGSPKMIVAPMVDRSEFAWRLLTRSYLDEERSKSLLAYTPMFHARMFSETQRFREEFFQPTRSGLASKEKSTSPPWRDGNPALDRPLFVQFCANKPEELLDAAQYVAPYCDAVDLNLGCPQGIAKAGHYGAFLQEDWDTIYKLINTLHKDLSVPVTAKMRILETREKTLEYAKMILSAGASILTVHGRRREQKGHYTGLADWSVIRYLRDNLPPETVIFANGNILNADDIDACLAATGADGVMSAEGNLSDPTIFAKPPKEYNPREYWYGPDGKGGYRVDAVFRRYLDIIYKYCLEKDPPTRQPLYIPGDPEPEVDPKLSERPDQAQEDEPRRNKKRKRNDHGKPNPNLKPMQGHLFSLLRHLLAKHTDIRDVLARVTVGDLATFERILSMVEAAVRKGLQEEAAAAERAASQPGEDASPAVGADVPEAELTPKQKTEAKYKRPWWVCQPYIRLLPEEAIKNGSLHLSKKAMAKMALEKKTETTGDPIQRTDSSVTVPNTSEPTSGDLPKPALVCG
ncbi:tRNA dihydrouridine synthase [Exophiala dermatitidis]|uniref:tRNA-dihydrouridine(16/17) synthase [NAD(P)(+)] n=1 Tax=Exophiala dermatitidis TaxID=5970 RepID=A0AAN6F227_EXODE|nr:tRNA dihydrouridine synthase [Exophiala dermatitidis]KAJ4527384.1 tRNA dihydrouridine synthase [Exophiala dermatitidis]KAJ4530945.1 tRNA dihydrouridine synthase [Exophiala dermatitidis]KAJ4558116.1 tRNA dihydrouridine synthase [Exophiala dermatitidis]KAJ4581854.1 tRNA dihydrouridine synthase [Exophiala dermatitidis]